MRCNGCLHDGVCWAQIEEVIEDNETSECFEDANNFVKVVRCKDCKNSEDGADGRILCTRRAHKWNGLMVGATATRPDDFCSYGERKEKDDGKT